MVPEFSQGDLLQKSYEYISHRRMTYRRCGEGESKKDGRFEKKEGKVRREKRNVEEKEKEKKK